MSVNIKERKTKRKIGRTKSKLVIKLCLIRCYMSSKAIE